MFAPASLPDKDAQKYATALQAALSAPANRDQFRKMGIAPEDMRLQEFAEFVKRENRKFQFLINATKIKAG